MRINFISKRNINNKEKYLLSFFLSAILLFTTVTITSIWIPNAYAQQQGQTPSTATTSTSNNQTTVGTGENQLKFSLKLEKNATTSETGQQQPSPGNSKNVTVNVNVQQGPGGKSVKLPVTAMVPKATQPQDLQLCVSIGANEQCQPLSNNQSTLDLTKGQQQVQNSTLSQTQIANPSSQEHKKTTLTSYQSTPYQNAKIIQMTADYNVNNYGISNAIVSPLYSSSYFTPIQLIENINIPIDIDVTAIIPINIDIENAQICANIGGDQSCNIINMSPTETTYAPTTIDLAGDTPTILPTTETTQPTTTTAATDPTAPLTTTQPPTTDTTTQPPTTDTTTQPPTTDTTTQPPTTDTTTQPPTTDTTTQPPTTDTTTQ